ncbi:hypothetical protein [Helicobacter apodemus]|uniref:Uncharacterized protein n=1 Tax=Helicobacter apodemus TaxID=135569 RepID=A0A2U8FDQ8_9HELI|nr:hypothetical protein [Helicobacter apodemus]AWI33967.1 hypothetical protein CDV25_03695 [Helicobacter apodemus]
MFATFASHPTIENITNSGTIKGGNYGLLIENGKIKNMRVSGTIEAKKNIISFFNADAYGENHHTGNIENITIENGGP